MANEFFNTPGATDGPAQGVVAKAFSINYIKSLYDKPGAWKHLRNFDADVAAYGESVTIPSFPRLTAVAASMTDGTFAADATSVTAQTILINKARVVSHKVLDSVVRAAKIDLVAAFADESGRSVNDDIDKNLVALIPSISATAGSLGSDLDETACLLALQSLVTNHVDLSNPEDFVWVLPASQFAAVHALKGYAQSYRIVAGSSNAEGTNDVRAALDTLYGIPVHFRSDTAMSVSTGRIGGLFYRDSVGIAVQRMPTMRQPIFIPGTINVEYSCYALYGIAIIKNEVAVKILCK